MLRLYKGKEFAEIFDFITLPKDLGSAYSATEAEIHIGLGLVKNELKRAFEFARLADNYVDANIKLDEIREIYNITETLEDYEEEELERYDD